MRQKTGCGVRGSEFWVLWVLRCWGTGCWVLLLRLEKKRQFKAGKKKIESNKLAKIAG